MSIARGMGGDSRFVWRWIRADPTRRHSIAITTQMGEAIPAEFADASSLTGGRVHCLDADTRDPILRARRLRSLVEDADFVALHLYPDDVVPPLALANRDGLPPVAFINHSDQTFWLGADTGDIVVSMRRSGESLSMQRRGIERQRLIPLPIPLLAPERTGSRADAKRRLGLKPDTVVLLSVSTEFKFAPVWGPGFLEVLLPVLAQHENAVLVAVGPRDRGEWAAARERTGGRVLPLGRRYDTAALFEAADVYIDSFPCTSPTSALEAGSYGLPVLTYTTHRGDARVFSPTAPGLDESVCALDDVDAFRAAVSAPIVDPGFRRQWGERVQRSVERHHQGAQWAARILEVYEAAAAAAPAQARGGPDHSLADTVDVLINRLYKVDRDGLGQLIDERVRWLPLPGRAAILRKMLRVNRSFSFDLFLPRWLARQLTFRPPYWAAARQWVAGQRVGAARAGRHASA